MTAVRRRRRRRRACRRHLPPGRGVDRRGQGGDGGGGPPGARRPPGSRRMTAITPGPVDLASGLEPAAVAWGADGLVAGVVQDVADGRVLMVGWLDAEALAATLATGEVHFHSRSRGTLWRKGETSGNVLRLRSLAVDCDGDALLLGVEPVGPTCHRGTRSCFDADGDGDAATGGARPQGFAWLESLWSTIAAARRRASRWLVHRHAARRRRRPRGPQGRRGGDRGPARGQERRGRRRPRDRIARETQALLAGEAGDLAVPRARPARRTRPRAAGRDRRPPRASRRRRRS